jgi:hypothetical protein
MAAVSQGEGHTYPAMHFQYRLRTLFVVIYLVALLMGIALTPVVRIDKATCSRIRPGMTEHEAAEAVGGPPGWYDGVGGIGTGSPGYIGYRPTWVGLRGEILVDLDASGRVATAEYYPAEWVDYSLVALFWERFTRVRFLGFSMAHRGMAFVAAMLLVAVPVCLLAVRPRTSNAVAHHGLVGLLLGSIMGPAMFSDLFFSNMAGTALTLLGPILGAVLGIGVGVSRKLLGRAKPNPVPS